MSKKYNDTGWMNYPEDYDDEGIQTYFDEPIKRVRFWEDKEGAAFYDVELHQDTCMCVECLE